MSTDDTTPALFLQATPELLRGWFGPVRMAPRCGPSRFVFRYLDTKAPPWGAVCSCAVTGEARNIPVTDLFLDLSRAECRNRVDRALATASGFPEHAAIMFYWAPMLRGWLLEGRIPWRRFPKPTQPSRAFCAQPDFESWGSYRALSALDGRHDTRLRDGSRRVDALARLHVARAVLHRISET